MFDDALLVDASGRPVQYHNRTHSRDWDEIRDFCDKVYMPYHVEPLGRSSRPDANMYSAQVGSVTVTRFRYGVPVALSSFNQDAGKVIVLTTLKGGLRHGVDRRNWAHTAEGESFVVDCSKTDYWLDADGGHLQLNLTISHKTLAETALRWYGVAPDDRLWMRKLKFGGPGSAWAASLDYMLKTIAEIPGDLKESRVAAHLEQMVCVELLRNWAGHARYELGPGPRWAAPHYVRRAESYIEAYASSVPTLTEIAKAVGVSVRTLSAAFRRFRNTTTHAFLREQRLQGVRRDLLASRGQRTVSDVAADWGYANFSIFARAYKKRFGELPSHTRKMARR